MHQLEIGTFVQPNKITVGDFFHLWLRDYATTNVRPRTIEGDRDIIDGHLVPNLGRIPLTQLNGGHLQSYC